MFKELGQMASLIKQAQAMKGKIAETKERLAKLECTGDAGGGMVTVTVGGAMKVLDCKIAPALFESGDKQMLENLVVAATNEAIARLMEIQAQEMSAITGGMNLEGLGSALSGLGLGGN